MSDASELQRLRAVIDERNAQVKEVVARLRAQEGRAEKLKEQRDSALRQLADERRRSAELHKQLAGERSRLEALAADYERLEGEIAATGSAKHLEKRVS
jgi:chromosome segregation ATPase